MTFIEQSSTFSEYLEFMKTKFNLNVSTAFGIDVSEEEKMLTSLADSHIAPAHNEYPTVYAFNDIGGINYILVRGGTRNESMLVTVEIDDDDEDVGDAHYGFYDAVIRQYKSEAISPNELS